jgi:hypothetical protein
MRPTYANAASTLALVLALGGTGAYAAGLAKDSVTSKQIKNGAIKGVDIKKDVITGSQVKESTLGKVPSAAKVDGLTRVTFSKTDTPFTYTPLVTRGPFTLRVLCDFAPTSTQLQLLTSANDSQWATLASSDRDFDVADGYAALQSAFDGGDGIEVVNVTVRGADGTSFTVTGSISARDSTCKADLFVLG